MQEENKNIQIGSFVRLKKNRTRGQVTEGPDRRGRFRVSIGSISLWASREDLEFSKSSTTSKTKQGKSARKSSSRTSTLRCDLHGQTKAEALETLDNCLNQALLQGSERIEVIHGIGKGILKAAALNYFKSQTQVQAIKPDMSNPGAFWVYL